MPRLGEGSDELATRQRTPAISTALSAVLARLSARRDMRWQRYNAKYGPDWATRLLQAIPSYVEEDVPRNQQFVG